MIRSAILSRARLSRPLLFTSETSQLTLFRGCAFAPPLRLVFARTSFQFAPQPVAAVRFFCSGSASSAAQSANNNLAAEDNNDDEIDAFDATAAIAQDA